MVKLLVVGGEGSRNNVTRYVVKCDKNLIYIPNYGGVDIEDLMLSSGRKRKQI